MPYTIEARADEWCVIGPDGKSHGCHASRAQAVKQQHALYANEARTASAENGQPMRIEVAPAAQRIEIASAPSELDPGLVASVQSISDRLLQTEENVASVVLLLKQLVDDVRMDRTAFQDALTAAVSNFPAPIPQEPPVVNVTVPETVVQVTTPEPVVNVTVEDSTSRRAVTFNRDLAGRIVGAEVVEVEE